MKKANFNNEFKVGLFVVLCLLGLGYLIFSSNKSNIKKGGYNIYVVFNDIAGLEEKAPVMLNGLEVGKVDDIDILYDEAGTAITLKLWLDDKAKVREDGVVSIKTLGLMGEKFIQISSVGNSEFLKPGAKLTGKPYMDIDALLEQAQIMTKNISTEVSKLVVNLNSTVEGNKGNVSQIVKNLEATSKNFEEFSDDIKRHPWKLLMKTKEKPPAKK
ncbi:MAG: MlaD family protein [Candidatus Omnitrophica bacterium]|nr:MlaD family protein [Candidatus Omnitrophota bacterium]